MNPEADASIARHVPGFVTFAALLAIIVGVAVLVGWALDIGVLKSLLPTWVAMKANTALCFILIGVAALSAARALAAVDAANSKLLAYVGVSCALLVGLIGSLTLAEYLSGWNPGIDQWLLSEPAGAIATSHSGRMAPESALCFLLLAIALVASRRAKGSSAITVTAIGSGLSVTALALAAMLSYLTPQLGTFGWFGFTLMAMHTALLFAFLGTASAALAWRRNTNAWSLGTYVTLMFAIGLSALVVAGLTLSRTQSSLKLSTSAIVLSEEIQDRTDLVRARVVQASGDLRTYIAGGDKRYLESYRTSNVAIEAHMTALRRSVAATGESAEIGHLSLMEELLAQRINWQPQILDAGHAGAGIASRNRVVGQTADELDILLGTISSLQDRHRQHIEALQRAADSAYNTSSGIILGATLLSILVFLFAMLRLNASETQRLQATRALVQSERHYRSAVQSAHDAIVTADGAGNVVGWKHGAEMIFGYTETEISGQALTVLMPERFRNRHLKGMSQALTGEDSLMIGGQSALAGLRKDGTEFALELSLARWDDGDQRFVTATLRDVSARKAAEQQIRMLSQAVEQSPESIVITNLQAEIEYVNHTFLLATGYSRDEVIGRNPRVLHSGNTPAATYVSLWAALAQGDTWQGEFYNRRKDGSEYTEFAIISPIRQADGRITHYLAVKEDITERKRAAEALRESAILLQKVIDATPDWIYVKDTEYRFTLVNRSFARAFGQTPENMIGRTDTEFLSLEQIARHESEGMRNFRGDDDAVLRGETIHDPCDRVFFNNGEDRVFDTFKYPLHDATRGIFGVLGVRRDITERINREAEQKALEAQLLQAQKMELVGHLTGGIAHDFNNILASILGYAELMQMSPDIRKNANLGKYLQEILQSGIRAKDLVAQLLTFSHKRVAATEAISVAPIVEEVMQLLRSTIPASISIRTVIGDELPEVLISPVQLHQIVMNLAVNARDAIDGTGSIDVRVESRHVDQARVCDACHLEFGGHLVLISVRDSGSGIPQANLSRIFDPFFTTKGVGKGSGLGLSVLHGIVHSANGHLAVRTKPGEGTEFRIFLPAQVPEARSSDPAGESARESFRFGGHVMVVDDEAVIVEYMKVLFEELGCRVTGVTSSSAALRLFESNPRDIDMVITDQAMPEMTGIELCRAMLARRPDLPIVMNTGYSSEIDAGMAQKIGIRRFLVKPVPAKVLEDLVAEYLPRHSRDLPNAHGSERHPLR